MIVLCFVKNISVAKLEVVSQEELGYLENKLKKYMLKSQNTIISALLEDVEATCNLKNNVMDCTMTNAVANGGNNKGQRRNVLNKQSTDKKTKRVILEKQQTKQRQYIKTEDKIRIGERNYIVYVGNRGGKYVRTNGEYKNIKKYKNIEKDLIK